ncbi:leucine-rich repeat domain-containing protein [Neorhodopirellula lusitana]|uniref:hypothetical protein n=1 Tax=Neorhodopirellula lusitana TaxID=445327 RepID=UPI00384E77E5
MNLTLQQRRLFRSVLCGLMFVSIFGYACMPRQIVATHTDWVPSRNGDLNWRQVMNDGDRSQQPSLNENMLGNMSSEPWQDDIVWSTAGFPFDAVHIQEHEIGVRYRWIGWVWALDVFAAVLLTGGIMSLAYRDQNSGTGSRRFHFAAAASLLIFMSGAASHWISAYQNTRLLNQAGKTALLCSVRSPLVDWLPDAAKAPWTHPYSFSCLDQTLFQVDSQSLDFQDFPSLQAIEISGALSPTHRDQVLSLPLLHTLRWREIPTGELVHSGALELPAIEVLDLAYQSNFSPAKNPRRSIRSHEPSKRLQRNDRHLSTTVVRYTAADGLANVSLTGGGDLNSGAVFDFRARPFLKTLRVNGVDRRCLEPSKLMSSRLQTLELELTGDDPSPFVIEAFPRLRDLAIKQPSSQQNSLTIEIREMPSLTSLRLPDRCPVSLTLKNVSKLGRMESSQRSRQLDNSILSDTAPWFRSLNIHGAPLLTVVQARVYAPDSWRIEGCPSLRSVQLGRPSSDQLEQVDVLTEHREATALDPVWQWLEGDLPLNSIKLERLDLRRVNLASWKRMPFLTEIMISDCETLTRQAEQFADLPALKCLRAPSMLLTDKSAKRLLAASDQWEELDLDWSHVNEIRIEGQANLVSAFGKESLRASKLYLKGLPRLEVDLHLKEDLKELFIEEMPKLQSLVVNGDIPSDAHVDGVQGMRCLCFRKNKLDCNEINFSTARRLQTLHVPNCEISQDLIDRLPAFTHLISLDLSGTRVRDETGATEVLGDEHAAVLSSLDKLLWVKLDGTDIGRETMEGVAECSKLRVVSVRGCSLDEQALSPLSQLHSLVQLKVDPDVHSAIAIELDSYNDENEILQLADFGEVWEEDEDPNPTIDSSVNNVKRRYLKIVPVRHSTDEKVELRWSEALLADSLSL